MSERGEWGPWTVHDGKGCPCVGMHAEVEISGGRRRQVLAGKENDPAWRWTMLRHLGVAMCWERGWEPVMSYRVKVDSKNTLLQQLIKVPRHECGRYQTRTGRG